jgi:hypothetical protein
MKREAANDKGFKSNNLPADAKPGNALTSLTLLGTGYCLNALSFVRRGGNPLSNTKPK